MPQAETYPSDMPKKLHFIWMGKPLPEKYLSTLSTFSIRNVDYELNLWSTSADRFEKTMHSVGMTSSRWRIRTLDELSLDDDYRYWINWEISGHLNNFAAASDLLRLAILHQEGGIYTDTDNTCLKSLGTLRAEYGFLVDMGGLDKNTLSNALMASAPGNPYINEMGLYILDKYNTETPERLERKRIPGEPERRDMTIVMSGPGALSRALEPYGHTEQRTLSKTRYVQDGSGKRVAVKENQVVERFVHDLLHGGFAPHPKIRFPTGLVHVASDKSWLGKRPRSAESPL